MINFILPEILQNFLYFVRIRDLVKVAENNYIIVSAVLQAPCHCIFLKRIAIMRVPLRRILNNDMNNLVRKFGKHVLVLFIV